MKSLQRGGQRLLLIMQRQNLSTNIIILKWFDCFLAFIRSFIGRAESEGRGGHFPFAAWLPFAPWKFQELQLFKKVWLLLNNFLKFRRNSAKFSSKKRAIWASYTKNIAKCGKIAEILQILRDSESKKNRARSGAKICESCRNIWFSLFFSPAAPRRPPTTNAPENPVSLLENRPFEKCMSLYFLF